MITKMQKYMAQEIPEDKMLLNEVMLQVGTYESKMREIALSEPKLNEMLLLKKQIEDLNYINKADITELGQNLQKR